jgi:cholesterol transport system auxiliary component
MKPTRKIRRCALMALTAITLAGCALAAPAPAPEDHFYRLPPPSTAEIYNAPLVRGTLGVAPLHAEGLYQERSILYIDAASPLEIHRYHYRYWFTVPGNLIQGHLADALIASGIAAKVIRYQPGAAVKGLVSGTIERFERVTGRGSDQARVTLTLTYGDTDQLHTPLLNKAYSATAPISGHAMDDAVAAFGTALNQIYNEFIHDLASTLKPDHP